jgi:hypothetical protein
VDGNATAPTWFSLTFTTAVAMTAGQVSGRLFDGGTTQFLEAPKATLSSVVSLGRRGVCGNGVCEVGESCVDAVCSNAGCLADCPRPYFQCDGDPDTKRYACNSHGLCNPSSGTCEVSVDEAFLHKCAHHSRSHPHATPSLLCPSAPELTLPFPFKFVFLFPPPPPSPPPLHDVP